MSKRLLGERQVGETVYLSGQIFTDEEAAATGLAATDFAEVKDVAAPAEAEPTPSAEADKGAEIDAQASKQQEEQSASVGADGGASSAASEAGAASADAETVEHVLTEQDIAENPDLTVQGLKVGDTVRVPKPVA